jgi:hypothetical protein
VALVLGSLFQRVHEKGVVTRDEVSLAEKGGLDVTARGEEGG